tara:strand:- start:146 stop:748 length:603 start_codon:yes stop_codon:yes gene_type:complete
MTILHLDCSARTEGSVTRALSRYAVDRLRVMNNSTVVRRDLTDPKLLHVDACVAEAMFVENDDLSERQRAALKLSDALTAELLEANWVVAGIPMYNFSVPSTFKSWIDHVVRPRKTFQRISDGQLEGLCHGKTLFACTAGNGQFRGKPIDHLRPYLENVFGFLGFDDIVFFDAERMAWGPEEKQSSIKAAHAEIDAYFAS